MWCSFHMQQYASLWKTENSMASFQIVWADDFAFYVYMACATCCNTSCFFFRFPFWKWKFDSVNWSFSSKVYSTIPQEEKLRKIRDDTYNRCSSGRFLRDSSDNSLILLLLRYLKKCNINGLLIKREVKIAWYWPSCFFVCLWSETESRRGL